MLKKEFGNVSTSSELSTHSLDQQLCRARAKANKSHFCKTLPLTSLPERDLSHDYLKTAAECEAIKLIVPARCEIIPECPQLASMKYFLQNMYHQVAATWKIVQIIREAAVL